MLECIKQFVAIPALAFVLETVHGYFGEIARAFGMFLAPIAMKHSPLTHYTHFVSDVAMNRITDTFAAITNRTGSKSILTLIILRTRFEIVCVGKTTL